MTAPTCMPWTTRTLTSLLVAGAALTLAPAPAHAAGATTIAFTRGAGGEALLTDYPADGRPVTGRSYHDTIISTALSVVRSDGTTSRGAFASFATTTYSFDAAGRYVEGAQTSGYADGAAVQLTVDRSLRSARLRATVPAIRCDQGVCSDLEPVLLTVDWTGTGVTTRTAGRQHLHDGRTTVTSWTAGETRSAQAMVSPFGSTTAASLWRGTSHQRTAPSMVRSG